MKTTISLLIGLVMTGAAGAVTYVEGDDGELSGTYTSPTPLALDPGDNTLLGTLAGGDSDVDLLTLTVPVGHELTAIYLDTFTGGGAGSFFGMQPGPILSSPPSSTFPDAIGFVLIGGPLVGTDVLADIVFGPPFNFQNPLPAGDYAVWLNETGPPSLYELRFEVTPIPEPGVALVLGVAGLAAGVRRKR